MGTASPCPYVGLGRGIFCASWRRSQQWRLEAALLEEFPSTGWIDHAVNGIDLRDTLDLSILLDDEQMGRKTDRGHQGRIASSG